MVVPTPWNTELAEQVQTAVEQWVHDNKGNFRSLTEWRKGWGYDIHITDITDINEQFETVTKAE